MKKSLIILAALGFVSGHAQACSFHWESYGSNDVRDLLNPEIGHHVTDEYCQKFNRDNELVVQYNEYVAPNMVIGHATVGIRKKNSNDLPIERFSSVVTNGAELTIGHARNLAVEASLSAIDDLMSSLRTYKVRH